MFLPLSSMSEPQPPQPPSSIAVDGELGDEVADDDESSGNSSYSSDTPPDDSEEITAINNGCNDFQTIAPIKWGGANPDAVLVQHKALKEKVRTQYGLKSFYESYKYWSKMTHEHQNKALEWFWRPPELVQHQL
jgi:hypothetical protein